MRWAKLHLNSHPQKTRVGHPHPRAEQRIDIADRGHSGAAPLHEFARVWRGVASWLVDEEAGGGEEDADDGDGDAAEPEEAFFGEERDGADDQPHFEEDFAAVEAVGAAADDVALGFEFLGLIADGV